ncbi:MAG: SDR family NAD(P)-dependent oxidoreductase, partial [Spirochaetales bacterium]|nr:SDR family NAD(P)-dependent oxidoreductase [Spirochaetales bacterium]
RLKMQFEEGMYNEILESMNSGKGNNIKLPSWFFEKKWIEQEPVRIDSHLKGKYILIFHKTSICEVLCKILAGEGLNVIFVQYGDGFTQYDRLHYSVHPDNEEDYRAFYKALDNKNITPDFIVNLVPENEETPGPFENNLIRTVNRVVNPVRMFRNFPGYGLTYIIITQDSLLPEHARFHYEHGMIQGLSRSIALENNRVKVSLVDLDTMDAGMMADVIVKELKNPGKNGQVAAYKRGKRFVPCFKHIDEQEDIDFPGTLKEKGFILITGGLGGIGYEVSRWLLDELDKDVLIIGQKKIDDVKDADSPANALLSSLKQMNGRLKYRSGDVSDSGFLRRIVKECEDEWEEKLIGIFHLAGRICVPKDQNKSPWYEIDEHYIGKESVESYREVFKSKITGTIALNQLRENDASVVMVVFSSVNGYFGGAGLSAYSAGNSFLESYCDYSRLTYPETYCIHWTMWNQTGMSKQMPGWMRKASIERGFDLVEKEKGILSLWYILSQKCKNSYIGLNSDKASQSALFIDRLIPVLNFYYCSDDNGSLSPLEIRNIIHNCMENKKKESYSVHLRKVHAIPRKSAVCEDIDIIQLLKLKQNHTLWQEEEKIESDKPGNKIEEVLITIWKEVLNTGEIGINDNFFEKGGDSIKAIQMTSRLNTGGYNLEIAHLFEHPVLHTLVPYINSVEESISQAAVTGKIDFIPIQKWFMETVKFGRSYFNMSVVCFRHDGFVETYVKTVFKKIIEHHDAFRIVLSDDDSGLISKDVNEVSVTLSVYTIRKDEDINVCINTIGTGLQSGIDVYNGPLFKLGLVKSENGDYLIIITHHLIMDTISLRIVLEDFDKGYTLAVEGKEIRFPGKTHSFKAWSEFLHHYGNSKKVIDEFPYWQNVCRQNSPVKEEIPAAKVKDNKQIQTQIDDEYTRLLLNRVNSTYNTEINDILLCALALAFNKTPGIKKIVINLEGHGREEIEGYINVRRTTGWFTCQYPFLLECDGGQDLGFHIQRIKEALRKVPYKGIGYGILRYLSPATEIDSKTLDITPSVSFNYLGQFDTSMHTLGFDITPLIPGSNIHPESEQLYILNIVGYIANNRLTISFDYNQQVYDEDSIGLCMIHYKKYLKDIIDHCTALDEKISTPGDFDDKDMDFETLDNIIDILNR